MITNPAAIILRERAPDIKGNLTGWIVFLAGHGREREMLAILTREAGLENARAVARVLASQYGLSEITEERLDSSTISNLQQIYQYPDF